MRDHQDADRLEHLEWLVDRRSEVQETLLALYKYVGKPPTGHPAVTDYLIYAAFSLWRAVFLAGSDRDWDSVFKGQKEFLAKLVEDNSISYSDDKNLSAWTVGYYLNVAKFCVLAAAQHITPEGPEYLPHGPMGPIKETRQYWDELHRDLRWMINRVSGSQLEVRREEN